MEAQLAPLNLISAKSALVALWKAVRSESEQWPEGQEPVDMCLPLSYTDRKTIVWAFLQETPKWINTTPPIRIPPAFRIDIGTWLFTFHLHSNPADHILVIRASTELVRQLLPPSTWSHANVNRQFVALNVTFEIAKQLLLLSISPVSPEDYTATDAANTLVAMAQSSGVHFDPFFDPLFDSVNSIKEDCRSKLVELSEPSNAVKVIPITPILSHAELATAARLISILTTGETDLCAAIDCSGDDEEGFIAIHSLLDRFAFRKDERQGPAPTHFTPHDVEAAQQLGRLFIDDPERSIGPIFITSHPPSPCSRNQPSFKPRLVFLCDDQDATRHLLKVSHMQHSESKLRSKS